jgi:hypothetical protein
MPTDLYSDAKKKTEFLYFNGSRFVPDVSVLANKRDNVSVSVRVPCATYTCAHSFPATSS